MGKDFLIVVVTVLMLSACGSTEPTPTPYGRQEDLTTILRYDLIAANLRVTDFPSDSLIEKRPYLIGMVTSQLGMALPDGVKVWSRVWLPELPLLEAATVQDSCGKWKGDSGGKWRGPHALLVDPVIGAVSRGELWTRDDTADMHLACFMTENLWGRVHTYGAKSADIAFKYARLLEGRMTEELRNSSSPTRTPFPSLTPTP